MDYEQKCLEKMFGKCLQIQKNVTTFAPAIEREILDKKDGPFVYRLGRKIFILERGVRFPHGLPNKEAIEYSIASLFLSALCRVCRRLS